MPIRSRPGRTTVALVCVLTALMFHASGHAKADDPPHARWIVGTSSPRAGDEAVFWLAVQPVANATSISVTFGTPHDATSKVLQPTTGCVENIQQRTTTCTLPAVPSILEIIVTPRVPGALGLIAVVHQTGPKLSPPVTDNVPSEAVTVRPWFDPGSIATGAITAFLGFLGGILTHVIVTWFDARRKANELVQETQAKLLKTLTPEIVENHLKLTEYLAVAGLPAPILAAGMYNTVLGDMTVAGFLSEDERRAYLARINPLYLAIAQYNRTVNQSRPDLEIQQHARAVLQLIPQAQP